MSWAMILKGLLVTTVKQKVTEVGKEGIYSSAAYLPLLYLVTAAPTLLLLIGLSLLVTAGVSQFYPDYFFPINFILVLASVATTMSAVMFLAFRILLRKLLPKEANQIVSSGPVNIEQKMEGVFAPFLTQLKEEQSLFKETHFKETK